MGNEVKTDGVGIFVAEKWADSVVRVERHSERILVLKTVLGDRLLNVSRYMLLTQGDLMRRRSVFGMRYFIW